MLNPVTWYRRRQARKRMYKELYECLIGVARSMDDFGDVILEEGET